MTNPSQAIASREPFVVCEKSEQAVGVSVSQLLNYSLYTSYYPARPHIASGTRTHGIESKVFTFPRSSFVWE